MAEPDYNKPHDRANSKTPGMVPVAIGTKATVTAIACNISGLTPSQRAARDAADG